MPYMDLKNPKIKILKTNSYNHTMGVERNLGTLFFIAKNNYKF